MCKERLSRKILQPDEAYVEFQKKALWMGVYFPQYVVPISHWVFYSVEFNIVRGVPFLTSYLVFKILTNIYYLYWFFYWVGRVQNRSLYIRAWQKEFRWTLIVMYIIYTLDIEKTICLSGILADWMLLWMFQEHGEILRELNTQSAFVFTNRLQRQRQQRRASS